jgi:tetratricopeptide (TPR) repeat protein
LSSGQPLSPGQPFSALQPLSPGFAGLPLLGSVSSFAARLPLVGRSQETVILLRAYEQAAAGGYFLALEGEPGIGKTRLAEEFLVYARSRGSVAVVGRSYEGESSLVYGPFIEALRTALDLPGSQARLQAIPAHWLAEAARLLPELASRIQGLPPAPPLEGLGAQARFLEGLTQVLLGLCAGAARADSPSYPVPGVLFLDDLHTADAATLNLLAYLARRLRGHMLFILVTWRKEGLPPDHPLPLLIADVQRAGRGSLLSLSRLRAKDVADLLQTAASAGLALPLGLGERLYQEAEGLPFFVVEYLASLLEGANVGESGDWAMPRSVRELLRARLAAVSEAGWQLLTTAAVIGRSFDFDTLRRSSGRSETETVAGLEGLIDQGLIQEHSGREVPVYDFNHEKLRAVVYEETSLARRRLLHRRVAEALLEGARVRQAIGPYAARIAHHYQLAGQEQQAAEYFRRAGEHARSLAANDEALAYFQAALAAWPNARLRRVPAAGGIGHAGPDQFTPEGRLKTASLYEAIGDLQTLSGSYSAAVKSYETAAALCEPACLARVAHKLGDLHRRRGAWDLSESHYRVALEALEERQDDPERARLYADWAHTAFQQGQGERALELSKMALELAEEAGEPQALAQAHNMLGILARHAEDFEAASLHLEKSLAFAERSEEAGARVAALNNLALAYGDQGKLDNALSLAQAALRLSIQQGDRHRAAALYNNLADLLHRSGRSEEAMENLKKAVVIFSEIGGEDGLLESAIPPPAEAGLRASTPALLGLAAPVPGASSAEIWKLTEW